MPPSVEDLRQFIQSPRPPRPRRWTAVSLGSSAGLSDVGYELAGFRFHVQNELDENRAALGQANFPTSTWIVGDVRQKTDAIVRAYLRRTKRRLDLLEFTFPCQGLSSSNPSRGKRKSGEAKVQEQRNSLMLAGLPIADALEPRVIVVENVRQILTLEVTREHAPVRLMDLLREGLPGYQVFEGVVNVADYGIPQDRRRAVVVAVRDDEPWLARMVEADRLPWPQPTHIEEAQDGRASWNTLRLWFEAMAYEPLDAGVKETACGDHELHYVPHYENQRYLLVSHIPANSGRGAYENDTCPNCNAKAVPLGLALCPHCNGVMHNRPCVVEKGVARLVKGFKSSYRRMPPDVPAPTVTTNSSHLGSDFKIHPWEHRVLSVLECADLQTVPRWYDWSRAIDTGRRYLIRNVIGEAFPCFFTYLHGRALSRLLSGDEKVFAELAKRSSRGLGHRRAPRTSC
jgi:DNA (cytosine-5)-methyltransferase 1